MPLSSAEAGVGGIMMACSGGEALGATFIPTFSELAVFTKQRRAAELSNGFRGRQRPIIKIIVNSQFKHMDKIDLGKICYFQVFNHFKNVKMFPINLFLWGFNAWSLNWNLSDDISGRCQ